jgi:hypothetical protein
MSAAIERARPGGVVPGEVFVLRGHRNRLMADRGERPVRLRAERDPLDRARPIAERVHLLARQREAHRAPEHKRTQHRQRHVVLRTQARAECAADKERDDAYVVGPHIEDAAQISLHVLHALGLVVNRELAAAVPGHGGREQLHRIVMLHRDVVFGLMAPLGRRDRLVGLATCLRPPLHREGFIALSVQIRDVRRLFVFDAHQRRRKTCDLPFLGEDQRDRLSAEDDLVVVERPEGRAFRRHVIAIGALGAGQTRPIFMGQHVDHAVDPQRLAGVDARDAALGDGGGDHGTMRERGRVELGRVLGRSGDLCPSVDAGGGGADVRDHGAHRIFLSDCDCGVAFAAWVKARTMPRRARSILKALCA